MNGINLAKDIYHLERENNPRRQQAITFSCLGKLGSADHSELNKWKGCLSHLVQVSLREKEVSASPLIIGLAESGIVPSGLCHQLLRDQGIHADWICSTRRPSRGIRFNESHSHAPDHTLPFPNGRPTELWFVEDEITTGRTVLRLALNLCLLMEVRQVRFLAIADTRSPDHVNQFRSILDQHGIRHSIHTVVRLKVPSQLASGGSPLHHMDNGSKTELQENRVAESDWLFPEQRPALRKLRDVFSSLTKDAGEFFSDASLGWRVTNREAGTVLVVGEAIDIALKLVRSNPRLSFRHVTLSPWKVDGKHIFSRLDICGKYYLYNYHNLRSPLCILNDPADQEIGREVERLLAENGFNAPSHLVPTFRVGTQQARLTSPKI